MPDFGRSELCKPHGRNYEQLSPHSLHALHLYAFKATQTEHVRVPLRVEIAFLNRSR